MMIIGIYWVNSMWKEKTQESNFLDIILFRHVLLPHSAMINKKIQRNKHEVIRLLLITIRASNNIHFIFQQTLV